MFPGDTTINDRDIENAHQVFQRVHAKCTPEMQARLGVRLVRCPHWPGRGGKQE